MNDETEEAPSNPDGIEGDPATPFQPNPNPVPESTPENPPQPPPVEEDDSEEDDEDDEA